MKSIALPSADEIGLGSTARIMVELVNKWHYGVNQGSEPVKLIMFYVGEVGTPLVIKEAN